MLCEIRQLQLKKANAGSARLAEVGDMYRHFDTALSGIRAVDSNNLAEVMISADFTYAILEFVQRQMVPGYERKGFAFEPLVKPDTVPNFLDVTRYQNRCGVDDLEYVSEKGEPRPGSVQDATKRTYRVYKWEKQFDFSYEALVNDDLGYLEDTARLMGASARRTLEKFVSRMYTNAVTIARLVALGALYQINGRLTSARVSEARMAFNQRLDACSEPINAKLRYIVHHSGLVDTVRVIRQSQLVPELATNAANVVAGDFVPIEDPYIAGAAPNLPWYAFTDWRENNIVPFVLARRQGVPAPMLLRRRSDIEGVTSLTGAGTAVAPIFGDFQTGNVVVKVHDEWGTYLDMGALGDGNMFDHRGVFYSAGTAP
jgi:hypothetical protein